MIFSIVLGGTVLIYTTVYMIKCLIPIIHFKRCTQNNEIKMVQGRIVEKVDEINKAIQGTMVNICLPKVEYCIGNEKRYYLSPVKYQNAEVGQAVQIGVCERTGEAWISKDIPLMKKDLTIRVSTIMTILLILLLTEIVL